MKKTLEKYKLKSGELLYIISRHIFLFTNGIITAVIILLFIFGDFRSGLFLEPPATSRRLLTLAFWMSWCPLTTTLRSHVPCSITSPYPSTTS